MDGPRFAKLCRETGLQAGRLNSVGTDIIFSKVKAKVRHCQANLLYLPHPPTLQAPALHGIQHAPGCVRSHLNI